MNSHETDRGAQFWELYAQGIVELYGCVCGKINTDLPVLVAAYCESPLTHDSNPNRSLSVFICEVFHSLIPHPRSRPACVNGV
jgi:hypothetical protein